MLFIVNCVKVSHESAIILFAGSKSRIASMVVSISQKREQKEISGLESI
jgi:hypothetical protein